MLQDDQNRRAIEEIKLRAPIEDVVRERIPELKRSGALWVACCPFHEEKTPSFKIDPRRGTWHCFGSCGTGGDQLDFVMRFDNLGFRDALEILAARTGVELPRKQGSARRARELDELHGILERTVKFFVQRLAGRAGEAARNYLGERGLEPEIVAAFGIGWAPAGGEVLVTESRKAGVEIKLLEAAGLARRNDRSEPYDFFRGRLMIPIRDFRGRPVGFGARRLASDDRSGPKYVNTPETPVFKKGRLVFGLERAIDVVRRGGHLVLVEGYTDVMAAHQVGLTNVVAVLGTSTTEEHAATVRRTGARRISLVFDGDAAGRNAAWKALKGLLTLDVTIDVATLPEGRDPCDLLVGPDAPDAVAAAAAWTELLDGGRDWFDFCVEGLAGLAPVALAREVDRVLELFGQLPRPVHRERLLALLAERIGVPVESLREQRRAGHSGRPSRPATQARMQEEEHPQDHQGPPGPDRDEKNPEPRLTEGHLRAFEDMLGALLCDSSLVPLAKPFAPHCGEPELRAILDAILLLYGDEDASIEAGSVMDVLAEHPARRRVVPLQERAARAESPRTLFEGQLLFLNKTRLERERDDLLHRLRECDESEAEPLTREIETVLAEIRRISTDSADCAESTPDSQPDSRTTSPASQASPASPGPNAPEDSLSTAAEVN